MTKITARHTIEADIADLVDVELERYEQLYKEHPKSRSEIEKLFGDRLKIAGGWMWTVLMDGLPVGFLSAMPTGKSPDSFKSWEDTTNNGTLKGAFAAAGQNVYVVNLDVARRATKQNAQYLLMAQLAAKVINTNKNLVYFESRMPMFREWVVKNGMSLAKWRSVSPEKQQAQAEKYAHLKVEKNGRRAAYDRLLRFYENSGFNIGRVVPNAFKDGESLDFGVVCEAKNPLPRILRLPVLRHIIGFVLSRLGNRPDLLEKFIS